MRKVLRLLSLTFAILFFISSTISSIAFAIEPTLSVDNNPSLVSGGIRIDPPDAGIYTYFDLDAEEDIKQPVPLDFKIEISYWDDAMQIFDFDSNYPIIKVVVKGGNQGANIYNYNPAVKSDVGLHAPININGSTVDKDVYTDGENDKYADVSHIDFYFGVTEEEDPVGKITVTKIVKDHLDIKLIDDKTVFTFKVEKKISEGVWEAVEGKSPFIIVGNGTATVNNLPLGTYKVSEINIPNNFKLSTVDNFEVVVINNDGDNEGVGFTNIKDAPPWTGSLKIQKHIQQPTQTPTIMIVELPNLSGFKFELWTTGNNPTRIAGPETTLESGIATFTSIHEGTYEVRETESLGYIAMGDSSGKFIVDFNKVKADGNIIYFEFYNKVISKDDIVIQKEVNGGSDLSGFTFRLYRIENEEEKFIDDMTTDSTGRVIFENQPAGDYVIYEDEKAGYIMGIGEFGSDKGREFYHDPEETKYPITVTNTKEYNPPSWDGSIRVEKTVYDEESRGYLENKSGFTFILYEIVEKEEVYKEEKVTESTGIVTFSNLPEGTYIVREKAKSGYTTEFDGEVVELIREVENSQQVVKVTNNKEYNPPNEKEKSRINVEKVVLDEDGNVIENDNAVFTLELLRKVAGEWRSEDTKTVEGNGTVQFRNLNAGTYMIEEIDIPDNYYLDSDNEIEIKLSEGETDKVEFTNIKVKEKEKEKEEEKDKEIEIVIEETTPEAPLEVIEPTPQVPIIHTLPKTGSASPLVSSGLGSILLGIGLFLKKKE